jgi:hypothetical protein
VPRAATLSRDSLTNNDWWSWNGYIQDSYSYKRLRVNAGLRWDWQQSKWMGGCVTANPVVPTLLPGQCEGELTGGLSPITGQNEELRPFHQFSPRMSLTYDIFGNGKTAAKLTGSYYYSTKITLANSLSGLGRPRRSPGATTRPAARAAPRPEPPAGAMGTATASSRRTSSSARRTSRATS